MYLPYGRALPGVNGRFSLPAGAGAEGHDTEQVPGLVTPGAEGGRDLLSRDDVLQVERAAGVALDTRSQDDWWGTGGLTEQEPLSFWTLDARHKTLDTGL